MKVEVERVDNDTVSSNPSTVLMRIVVNADERERFAGVTTESFEQRVSAAIRREFGLAEPKKRRILFEVE